MFQPIHHVGSSSSFPHCSDIVQTDETAIGGTVSSPNTPPLARAGAETGETI